MSGLLPITERAARDRLAVMGAFHAGPQDGVDDDGTLVLLGPCEPGFWAHVRSAPEFSDDRPDPLDRWSVRVTDRIARDLGGTPLYPFGQPVRPFISWALASGRAWSSPVGLLVHETAGLLVSYRSAVLLPVRLALPETGLSPCESCREKPCLNACPPRALTADGYGLSECHAYLDTEAGRVCVGSGCQVRLACPISQSYHRDPAQSAYHMRQFH